MINSIGVGTEELILSINDNMALINMMSDGTLRRGDIIRINLGGNNLNLKVKGITYEFENTPVGNVLSKRKLNCRETSF